ncbi:MAG: SPASM domain-containing protein, partial [Chitinivibrionales bacterium]
ASYVRGHSTICVLQPTCGQGVALEHTGDVYSCDHYVEPDYLLGNIKQTSIEKLVGSQKQRQFGGSKSATLPRHCKECEYLFTCYGECPKNRVLPSPDGDGKINWLCEGLKNFFAHSKEPMQRMAQLLASGRTAAEIMG